MVCSDPDIFQFISLFYTFVNGAKGLSKKTESQNIAEGQPCSGLNNEKYIIAQFRRIWRAPAYRVEAYRGLTVVK